MEEGHMPLLLHQRWAFVFFGMRRSREEKKRTTRSPVKIACKTTVTTNRIHNQYLTHTCIIHMMPILLFWIYVCFGGSKNLQLPAPKHWNLPNTFLCAARTPIEQGGYAGPSYRWRIVRLVYWPFGFLHTSFGGRFSGLLGTKGY